MFALELRDDDESFSESDLLEANGYTSGNRGIIGGLMPGAPYAVGVQSFNSVGTAPLSSMEVKLLHVGVEGCTDISATKKRSTENCALTTWMKYLLC